MATGPIRSGVRKAVADPISRFRRPLIGWQMTCPVGGLADSPRIVRSALPVRDWRAGVPLRAQLRSFWLLRFRKLFSRCVRPRSASSFTRCSRANGSSASCPFGASLLRLPRRRFHCGMNSARLIFFPLPRAGLVLRWPAFGVLLCAPPGPIARARPQRGVRRVASASPLAR